jgi:hypothetical protein
MLVAIYFYAMNQRPKLLVFRASIVSICAVGLIVVWAPELSTRVANAINIGRGADLISYLWIAMTLVISINIHIRLKLEAERVTQLAREIAILTAKTPKSDVRGPESS